MASRKVTTATRRTLTAAAKLDSPLGQAALVLAARMDSAADESGSALAAVAKELRTTLAEAVKGAATVADPVDQLRARREARRRAGA